MKTKLLSLILMTLTLLLTTNLYSLTDITKSELNDLTDVKNGISDLSFVADYSDEDNGGIMDIQELDDTFFLTLNTGALILIEIDLDQFSTEIGWSLSQEATTLFSVPYGTYTAGNITVTQTVTVTKNGNYQFIITDLFGDGMQGNSYRIIVDGATVINRTFGTPTDATTFSQTNDFLINTITTLSTTTNSFDDEMIVYPNPTHDSFKISFNNNQKALKINIYSSLGQLVQTGIFENTDQIQMNLNQPSGTYIVEYTNDKGNQTAVRLIKK